MNDMNRTAADEAIIQRTRDAVERENNALALVLDRAEISDRDLKMAQVVLRKIALVELDDLQVPPAFDLLADGSISCANTDTPQWQSWSDARDFVQDANHLEIALFRAGRAVDKARSR